MTKVINYPYLNFTLSKIAAQGFFDRFNENQDFLRDKLRKHHWQTLIAILEIQKYQIAQRSRNLAGTPLLPMKAGIPQKVDTNRAEIARRTNASSNTVGNHIRRLMQCEIDGVPIIIEKKWHGTKRNFELFINPEIGLIADRNNREYAPKSQFLPNSLTPKNQRINPAKAQNLCLLYQEQKTSNNVINGVNKVTGNPPNIPTESLASGVPIKEPLTRATEGRKKNQPPSTDEEKIRRPESHELIFLQLIEGYTENLLQFALRLLWPDETIYPGEIINARRQLSKYFSRARNQDELEHWYKLYRQRLNMVAGYLNRKTSPSLKQPNPPDRRTLLPYPAKYFNPDNPHGFRGTAQWLEKFQKGIRKSKARKNFNRAVKMLKSDPHNYNNYSNALAIIKNNCPNLVDEFNQIATQ